MVCSLKIAIALSNLKETRLIQQRLATLIPTTRRLKVEASLATDVVDPTTSKICIVVLPILNWQSLDPSRVAIYIKRDAIYIVEVTNKSDRMRVSGFRGEDTIVYNNI